VTASGDGICVGCVEPHKMRILDDKIIRPPTHNPATFGYITDRSISGPSTDCRSTALAQGGRYRVEITPADAGQDRHGQACALLVTVGNKVLPSEVYAAARLSPMQCQLADDTLVPIHWCRAIEPLYTHQPYVLPLSGSLRSQCGNALDDRLVASALLLSFAVGT
jgi:hypothetical protein